jgi:hypothetical protein
MTLPTLQNNCSREIICTERSDTLQTRWESSRKTLMQVNLLIRHFQMCKSHKCGEQPPLGADAMITTQASTTIILGYVPFVPPVPTLSFNQSRPNENYALYVLRMRRGNSITPHALHASLQQSFINNHFKHVLISK